MKKIKLSSCTIPFYIVLVAILSIVMTFNILRLTRQLINAKSDMTIQERSDINNLYNYNKSMERTDNITTEHTTRALTKPSNSSFTHPNGTRKDSCISCFVHNFKLLINNENICDNNDVEIDIVILIFTIHQNKAQRTSIRNTWLTYSKNNTANIRYAFVLGYTHDKRQSDSVKKEAALYGDIIKEDFIDAYANLTYKTVMAFRWVKHFCSQAKFVMKTDDDVWVNVPNLLETVKNNSETLEKSIGGSCAQRPKPIRYKSSKWYVSYKFYPKKEHPSYCSGVGYVTTTSVAKKIFEISKHVPYYHLEDIYVAFCIAKLGFIVQTLNGFHWYRVIMDPCLYKSSKVVTSHEVSPRYLYNVWNTKCH